jgi:predicted nuclease of restriction endonuclease-like RecB superfamily
MDSSWEVACATRLDELDINWERDPTMKLPYTDKKKRKRNYIPDFYLPDIDLYIEVKGYWTAAAKHKMKDIMKRNPGKFCLLESLNSITTLSLPILATTGSVPS